MLLEKSPTDTYEFINRPCRNIVQENVTKLSQHELELEGMDFSPWCIGYPKYTKIQLVIVLLWHLQSVA